jgi:hypothetical protein
MMYTKKCATCGEVKPITMFSKDKTRKDGHRYSCKVCQEVINKKYRKTEAGKIVSRRRHVKKSYGISLEEYEERLQGKVCGVCGTDKELCYDHCHTSGEFRGVLCSRCNRSIGQLGDNAESLLRAYNYLKTFEESK